MNNEVNKILAASGGAFAGGAAVKMMKKSDGSTNPVAAIGAAGVGIGLAVKGKSPMMKAFGMGLAAIGVVATVGLVAEKVPMLNKVTPHINGLGELYEDEDGNLIELGGLGYVDDYDDEDLEGLYGQPQLVQDESGKTYMVEGLAGDDDMDDLVGLDGDDNYDDYDDLDGIGELTDLV